MKSCFRLPIIASLLLANAYCQNQSYTAEPHELKSPYAAAGASGGVAMMDFAWMNPKDRERLAREHPLIFLKLCRRHSMEWIKDYRCRFTKKERINGVLMPEQETEVLYRERPFSVNMRWIRNPGRARRVTYVRGKWVQDGQEMFLAHPAGLLALLVPKGVKRAVSGPDAKASARRTIDQFGFHSTLDLILKYCEMAKNEPGYALRYVGRGSFAGRPTYQFERLLPLTRENEPYPDRLLEIHIDREWLVPTGCTAYADDNKETLLGRYETTDVTFNIGLTNADF